MNKDLIQRLRHFDDYQLLMVYNHYSTRQLEKFSDRGTAEVRVANVLAERGLLVSKIKTENVHETLDMGVFVYTWKFDPDRAIREQAMNNAIDESDRIRVLVKKNPKRKGSEAWARFNDYRDGMLVLEWYNLNLKKRGHHGRGSAANDLRYDESKGFIEIVKTDDTLQSIY